MDERAAQIFTGLSVLVLLWIGVYWLWEPSTPRVSHAAAPVTLVDAAPEPAVREPPHPEIAPPGVTPPEFITHELQAGETFETIARDQFGDAAKWGLIARANPLKDPRRLKPGQTIRIPVDERNIQGLAPPAEEPAPRRHIVQPGDTLSSIAARYLGSSVRAGEIFELNRDKLRDMHSLRVGQELRLPPAD